MKKLIVSYTFDASAKTIVAADFTSLEKIQIITNVTDNIIIYNFADAAKGGMLSGTTLTLDYDTTSMDDSDKLQIFVHDDAQTIPVTDNGGSLTVDAVSLPLPIGAAIAANQQTDALTDTQLRATAVPVSGTVTANIGTVSTLATAAKQDLLLTELQLKADLTETQPVSLASVPSHNVTNAGTFPVQATLSAETTKVIGTVNQGTSPWVTSNATTSVVGNGAAATAQRVTLANDSTGVIGTVGAVTAITNALPAGTNAIGKLAANSGVDIGDVDVTSLPAWGTVSTANSTAVNLAGGAVFTGTSENIAGYAAVQVTIFSSHASATDGLSLQQSSNGTNWDMVDTYTIPAATGKTYSIQSGANFFRLVYTNGATLTTSLRIQTVFHVIAPNPSSQRTSDAYTNETDMTQQWAFNSLWNNSTWDRVRAVANATNSTGTGIAAAGVVAQLDDTSPTAITENQFGNIRMAADRSLLVTNRATTPTQSSVAGSATSVTLLAASNARKGATVYNDSTAILYLKLGATASTTSHTIQIAPSAYYEVPFGYIGIIDGIWASAAGNARITEIA